MTECDVRTVLIFIKIGNVQLPQMESTHLPSCTKSLFHLLILIPENVIIQFPIINLENAYANLFY